MLEIVHINNDSITIQLIGGIFACDAYHLARSIESRKANLDNRKPDGSCCINYRAT